MTTLEQVEKLRERADVSYEEAKAALDIAEGDMLEAVIYLEKIGKIDSPQMSAYNTKTGGVYEEAGRQEQDPRQGAYWQKSREQDRRRSRAYQEYRGPRCRDHMRRLWQGFCSLVKKGNANQFVVTHDANSFLRMPVTLFVIAILCFPWVSIPLLIIGLFCDCRYEFRGPNFKQTPINSMMDKAADTAESIKRTVVAEAAEAAEASAAAEAAEADHEQADWDRDDDDR